jgi:hypothetical protein
MTALAAAGVAIVLTVALKPVAYRVCIVPPPCIERVLLAPYTSNSDTEEVDGDTGTRALFNAGSGLNGDTTPLAVLLSNVLPAPTAPPTVTPAVDALTATATVVNSILADASRGVSTLILVNPVGGMFELVLPARVDE